MTSNGILEILGASLIHVGGGTTSEYACRKSFGASVMQVSYRRSHAIVCLEIVVCSKIKRLTRTQDINLIFRIVLAKFLQSC